MTIAAQQSSDAALRRRRVVVLNADIADYSRLMADDEAATVAAVRGYQALVADAVVAGDGTLVNFVGDSFVAVFDHARGAMRTAMQVCRTVKERNDALPRTRQMWFRIGLDAGEVVVAEDGRYYGEPLNIAARIQAIAETGGINVTEGVYRELDEPALRLIGLGSRHLKNIPGTVRVYRLAGVAGERTDHAVGGGRGAAPGVAVLPVLGAEVAATRDIAQALRLEVVTALTRVPGLRVIDVASAASAGPSTPLAVGSGAPYSLAVGVARSGDRLRAYSEIVETATFNRVWGQRWDGTVDDVFALQDALADGTARALEVELVVGEPARIYRSHLDDTAREAVYLGRYHLLLGTREGWRRATELFASVEGPDDAETVRVSLMSFVLWWGAANGMSDDPSGDLDRAEAFARRGVELDDDTGLSQMVLAALRLHTGGDLDMALAEARQALKRRPTCDVTFAVEASVQRYLGAWEAATASSRRALELSLRSIPWYTTVLASAYYVGERYHEAIDAAEQVIRRTSDGDLEALAILASSQQALGLSRRARATAGMIIDRFPGVRCDDVLRRHPFRDPAVLERWRGHLTAAGLP
jgi:adenylate cyclase